MTICEPMNVPGHEGVSTNVRRAMPWAASRARAAARKGIGPAARSAAGNVVVLFVRARPIGLGRQPARLAKRQAPAVNSRAVVEDPELPRGGGPPGATASSREGVGVAARCASGIAGLVNTAEVRAGAVDGRVPAAAGAAAGAVAGRRRMDRRGTSVAAASAVGDIVAEVDLASVLRVLVAIGEPGCACSDGASSGDAGGGCVTERTRDAAAAAVRDGGGQVGLAAVGGVAVAVSVPCGALGDDAGARRARRHGVGEVAFLAACAAVLRVRAGVDARGAAACQRRDAHAGGAGGRSGVVRWAAVGRTRFERSRFYPACIRPRLNRGSRVAEGHVGAAALDDARFHGTGAAVATRSGVAVPARGAGNDPSAGACPTNSPQQPHPVEPTSGSSDATSPMRTVAPHRTAPKRTMRRL